MNNIPGKFIYSKEYVFQGGSHGSTLQIVPYEKMRELLKAGELPRDFGKNSNHYMNFMKACRGEEKTNSPFSVAGTLSQMLTLGCLAQRLGGELRFDRNTKRITNNKLANSLLKDNVRKGWEQYYRLARRRSRRLRFTCEEVATELEAQSAPEHPPAPAPSWKARRP